MTGVTIGPETRVRISPSVYARAFGDEIVLLDFGRGEYFGLDETGAEIWRRIESGDALQQIADHIVERYQVQREEALRDIIELITTMNERALVTVT